MKYFLYTISILLTYMKHFILEQILSSFTLCCGAVGRQRYNYYNSPVVWFSQQSHLDSPVDTMQSHNMAHRNLFLLVSSKSEICSRYDSCHDVRFNVK